MSFLSKQAFRIGCVWGEALSMMSVIGFLPFRPEVRSGGISPEDWRSGLRSARYSLFAAPMFAAKPTFEVLTRSGRSGRRCIRAGHAQVPEYTWAQFGGLNAMVSRNSINAGRRTSTALRYPPIRWRVFNVGPRDTRAGQPFAMQCIGPSPCLAARVVRIGFALPPTCVLTCSPVWQNPADVGPIFAVGGPAPCHIGRSCAAFRPKWSNLDRAWGEFDRHQPNLVGPNLGRFRQILGRVRPTSAKGCPRSLRAPCGAPRRVGPAPRAGGHHPCDSTAGHRDLVDI